LASKTLAVKTNLQLFQVRKISQDICKLVRIPILNSKKKKTNPQLLASGSEKKKKQSIIASSVALICWLLEMAQERALIIIVFPFVFYPATEKKSFCLVK
jgi:hypothetical protein